MNENMEPQQDDDAKRIPSANETAYRKPNGSMASDMTCIIKFPGGFEIEFSGWCDLWPMRNYQPVDGKDPVWLEFKGASEKLKPIVLRLNGEILPIENLDSIFGPNKIDQDQ